VLNRWSLLFLTDVHYELPNANFCDDPKELEFPALRDNIFTDFQTILTNAFPPQSLDLVAVAGDITTHGKKSGIERFEQDVLPWLRLCTKRREAICIVPGNHDVTWGVDPTAAGSFRTKFASFWKLVRDGAQVTSCLFPDGELTKETDSQLSFLRPPHGPIYVDHERKLLALCINSAIRCGELNLQMQDEIATPAKQALADISATDFPKVKELLLGLNAAIPKYLIRDVAHVTQAQRRELANLLRNCQVELRGEWNSYLRVAILHHHVIHFANQITEHKGYELLLDSAGLLSLLGEFDFDLVLTGHKHQPYEVKHLERDKEMLLVGGPTIGGYSAGDAFRGVRLIEVEDHGLNRAFKIIDIPYSVGEGNVAKRLEDCRKDAVPININRPPEAALEQRAKLLGFFYREVASITVIDPDGDARRIVESDDLTVQNDSSDRALCHRVRLPSTSGHLDALQARGKGFTIRIANPIPINPRVRDWNAELIFDEPVGNPKPASYTYQWYALNSFALDKLQFDYMYGPDPERLNDIEFTHFASEDPIQELTVVVRFPPGYQPQSPRLRIARVNPDQRDSRQWEIDARTQTELSSIHALRYYESLNIAALRVRHPQPNLSYGIQWEVANAPSRRGPEYPIIMDIWQRLKAIQLTRPQREGLLQILARIMIATRDSFLSGWSGPIDTSLMYFDGAGELPVLVAAVEDKNDANIRETRELIYQGSLRYGDGIAGRAFKANRLRVYVSPEQTDGDTPNYYARLAGSPAHKVLISLPVHLPESAEALSKNPRAYESKMPYAVINLGSERAGCPLEGFRLPERIPHVMHFQHDVNSIIYQQLKEIL
jgi:predicted phosphodiesterase